MAPSVIQKIDTEYACDTPDLITAITRKQFFLPEHKPYVYVPREN